MRQHKQRPVLPDKSPCHCDASPTPASRSPQGGPVPLWTRTLRDPLLKNLSVSSLRNFALRAQLLRLSTSRFFACCNIVVWLSTYRPLVRLPLLGCFHVNKDGPERWSNTIHPTRDSSVFFLTSLISLHPFCFQLVIRSAAWSSQSSRSKSKFHLSLSLFLISLYLSISLLDLSLKYLSR